MMTGNSYLFLQVYPAAGADMSPDFASPSRVLTRVDTGEL